MTGTSGSDRRAGRRPAGAAAVVTAALRLFGRAADPAGRRESASLGALPSTPAPPLEVMTFNLRRASRGKPDGWAARRPVMSALLHRAAPHVIGTQEGRRRQLRDVGADLGPHYDRIGVPRAGRDDEAVAVFWDTRRLVPTAHEHFWLSDTPAVRGSDTWGGGHPRMVTWVRFRDLWDAGREFVVLNTHLDDASRYARVRAAALIAEWIARFDPALPLLLTGDFNAVAHDGAVHGTLLAAGLVDTWDTARAREGAYATFHGYGPLVPGGDRIDWILATPGVTVHRAWTDTFAVDGRYPSDHLPVRATVSL